MSDDPIEWYENPEHEHMAGIDHELADKIIDQFGISPVFVECGVEGARSFSYHFRILGIPDFQHGAVAAFVSDFLSRVTPFRFEVQCVESFYTE